MADNKSLTLLAMELFEDALDQPKPKREDWIAEQAGENEALRDATLSLLRADSQASSMVRTGGAPNALPADDPEQVGAYRILRTLGRGGMGAVFLGERTSGDFEHKVAVKVVRPGVLTKALIDRFERERQIVATLNHPNIAQLFDGGQTDDGEPYFVMEYVDGIPLSLWVAEHNPGLDARLDLFGQICAAVGFAHQSLIIHRDLTPSNILVTRSGQVKLIDFGISKPADQDDAEPRADSSLTNLSLTPGFAAPERRSGAAATTLADIYSLGKILEGLVGALTDPDLDAIVAKACAEEPADRYPSVDALADDLQRYRAGLPVPARQGGRGYVVRKFIARHRPAVVAASLGFALLVGAFALTAFAYSRAEAARVAEEARFEELRSLAHYMLFDHNDRLERIVGTVAARVELADRAQTYLSELAASPRASDALKLEAAQGFIKLARIRGVPVEPNLGQRDVARENLDQAIGLLENITDPEVEVAPDLAIALAMLSMIEIHGERDFAGGGQSIARAASALGAIAPSERDDSWLIARSDVRKAQLEYATMEGRVEDIIPLADLLESETDRWSMPLRNSRAAAMNRAFAAYWRAYSVSFEGEREPTIAAFREAERRFVALDRLRRSEPLVLYMLTWTHYMGSAAASEVGDQAESRRMLGQARQTIARLLALEENDAALQGLENNIVEQESQALARRGAFSEALAIQREAVERGRRRIPLDRPASNVARLGFSLSVYAEIAQQARNRPLACSTFQESLALFEEAERKGGLGNYRSNLRYVRENSRRCATGVPVSDFIVYDANEG